MPEVSLTPVVTQIALVKGNDSQNTVKSYESVKVVYREVRELVGMGRRSERVTGE